MTDSRLKNLRFLWEEGADRSNVGGELVRRQRGHLYSRPVSPDDELTTTEAAAAAGVSRMTIHRWIENGELPVANRTGERKVRVADIRLAALSHGGLPKAPTPNPKVVEELRRQAAVYRGFVPASVTFKEVELEIFGNITDEPYSLG